MFNRVNFYIAFGQCGRARRLRNIFHARFNLGFAVEVHAPKTHAAVHGRGQNRHVHAIAAVQADAGKSDRTIERLLIEHGKLDKTQTRLARLHLLLVLNYSVKVNWFTDRHFFLLAVIFYGLSSAYSVFLWRKGFRTDDRVNYLLLLGAFILHTTAMGKRGLRFDQCPVNNLYEATVFIAWAIVTAYLVIGIFQRLRFLGAFASHILFFMGVFALMPALDPPHATQPDFSNGLVSLHATLILLGIGAFGLSAVAALMFLTEEHDLKFHKLRAIFSLLPPIQRLERVMNNLLLGGIFLLTAGLCISPFLLKEKFGVYFKNDPLLDYSIFIWLFYLALIVARWKFGQRGRRFAWSALGSFIFILLTFWGFLLLSPIHNP
jgi:HemX protein